MEQLPLFAEDSFVKTSVCTDAQGGGLRLTPEKREQLRRLTEAVEHGTARFITYEADLAAGRPFLESFFP